MKYIKLFENFDESNWENVKQNIDDIFIELVDLGFKVDISTGYNYTNVSVNIEVPDNSKYNISMVKDYILMFVDYMKHTWSEFYVYANYEYKLNVWMKRNNWKPNGFSKIYYKL